jgi:putative nucleotidyltransferase with HDIG domain
MKTKYQVGDKIKLPDQVKKLVQAFDKSKFDLFIVGGASRGLLTGFSVADWDFATNATPEQIQALFPKNNFYNNDFGTVSIILGKDKKDVLEVTTYRTEEQYQDFRRPKKLIWGKTIKQDLSRRDFTINAIAVSVKCQMINDKCQIENIIDPYSGIKDLEKEKIKAVGNPDERFREDALRLFRAIRIATELSFIIDKATFKSLKKNAELIKKIAWERIRVELFKLLTSNHPADGILLLFNAGLLQYILPEIITGRGVDQAKHHVDTVWQHELKTLEHCPSRKPLVRLAALLHDVGKPATAKGKGEDRTFYNHEVVGAEIAKKIGKRLKLSNKQLDKLYRLVRWHQFSPNEKQTDAAIRRFIRRVGKENLQDILDIRTGDRLGSGVPKTSWRTELFKKRLAEVQKRPFSVTDLKIDGHDVMKTLKVMPGPKVGQILETLFEEVKDNKKKNTRQYLLKRLPQAAEKILAKEN